MQGDLIVMHLTFGDSGLVTSESTSLNSKLNSAADDDAVSRFCIRMVFPWPLA